MKMEPIICFLKEPQRFVGVCMGLCSSVLGSTRHFVCIFSFDFISSVYFYLFNIIFTHASSPAISNLLTFL